MMKCPYCGSTAQFRTSTPMYFEDGAWKQQRKCGCGCVVVVRYTAEIDKIEYPEEADDASRLTHLTRSIIKAVNKRLENK